MLNTVIAPALIGLHANHHDAVGADTLFRLTVLARVDDAIFFYLRPFLSRLPPQSM
jgi:hypothetical protein